MHAIRLFACRWFRDGTLLHAFCPHWNLTNGSESRDIVSASEWWTKWCSLLGLGLWLRERSCEKPTLWLYLSAAPLESSQSSLTTEDMFSLCENQPLWYAGKMLFFTPNCCLWEASVKTTSDCKAKLIKVTIWKVHALILHHSGLHENSKFACVIVEVNFPLWSVNVQNVCNTRHKKADGFLCWIGSLLNDMRVTRCTVPPNYYSFEKRCWCSSCIQNGGWCCEYICLLNSELKSIHNASAKVRLDIFLQLWHWTPAFLFRTLF